MNETIYISLDKIHFTHSRVRPFFTGCGKRIEDTLAEIKCGTTKLENIPLITVIENDNEYYSLNNRRLFMLKCLHKDGFIVDGKVRVVKKQPLTREINKYTKFNCSLTATLMKEFSEDKSDGLDNSCSLGRALLKDVMEPHKPNVIVLHTEVIKAMKDLKKLVKKGKIKQVQSMIDEWIMNGLISDGHECDFLKSELSLKS